MYATCAIINQLVINVVNMLECFSKAYDKVDREFLFRAMDNMGFPLEFTQMLFHGAQACVSVNGRCSQQFSIRQGVRLRVSSY